MTTSGGFTIPHATIVTLISAVGLAPEHVAGSRQAISDAKGEIVSETPFDAPFAIDLVVKGASIQELRFALEAVATNFDVVCQPDVAPRRKGLLVADMDSTMIGQECIDELADFAGLKAEIAAVTSAAMHGKIDFKEALRQRVAALKGLESSAITQCLNERIHITPGAKTLVRTMKALGARTCLVSGGFTAFTSVIAKEIGFDEQHANILNVKDGRLEGTVGEEIVDSAVKRQILLERRRELALSPVATLAIGDGANDIKMIEEAGLGVAYHAKPATREAADAAIRHGDLRTLLWAQGIPQSEWAA